jgi:myo-inositol-1(or 4)-monophosphatase
MNLNDIEKIGRDIRKAVLSSLVELRQSASLGKGAAGDITHPIDKLAEDIVIRHLEELKQPVTLLSEECGYRDFFGGGPRLLLDPIDGSRNSLGGITLFATSIALIDGDRIGDTTAGYVINIISGDEYRAEIGKGAFLNNMPVQPQRDDTCRVVAYETQVPGRDIGRILPLLSKFNRTRCFGSTALDMAFLAQGALSVFVVPAPSRSFDFAAGYLLVKEAGGIVTDLDGNSVDDVPIGVKRASSLLAAANRSLHEMAIAVLHAGK